MAINAFVVLGFLIAFTYDLDSLEAPMMQDSCVDSAGDSVDCGLGECGRPYLRLGGVSHLLASVCDAHTAWKGCTRPTRPSHLSAVWVRVPCAAQGVAACPCVRTEAATTYVWPAAAGLTGPLCWLLRHCRSSRMSSGSQALRLRPCCGAGNGTLRVHAG